MSYTPFDAVKIGIASPEKILSWSYGEVKNAETINYRTLEPERGGLFCERIFGPTKDWECHCGRYKKIRYKGIICGRCGVEVTKSKVRRERMGHIELATPVSHIWYCKGIPSIIGLMLDLTPRQLEKVLYFANYIVTDPGDAPLERCQLLNEREYRDMREKYEDDFKVGIGAEAIRELLSQIDCEKLAAELREQLSTSYGLKKAEVVKRYECVNAFVTSGNRPEWMIITVLPVLPPSLRPLIPCLYGRFISSDLNDLYRCVINRNNRLKILMELGAPEIIIRNEKRLLQEAVDALIDNGHRGRAATNAPNRELKSLGDRLRGRHGRFRQSLCGKRIDYSGSGVVVPDPRMKIDSCGLPKEMALELYKPFVIRQLMTDGIAENVSSAKRMVECKHIDVWDALYSVTKDHPVLLSRESHGLQAFSPVLVDGHAIRIHPLTASKFNNVRFDGEQISVLVPLAPETIAEAKNIMNFASNILSSRDGKLSFSFPKYVLEGLSLLFSVSKKQTNVSIFKDRAEVELAYFNRIIAVNNPIIIRDSDGITETTMGLLKINEKLPQNLQISSGVNWEIFDATLSDVPHEMIVSKRLEYTSQIFNSIIIKCVTLYGTDYAFKIVKELVNLGTEYTNHSISDYETNFAEILEEQGNFSTLEYFLNAIKNRKKSISFDYKRREIDSFAHNMQRICNDVIIKETDCGTEKGFVINCMSVDNAILADIIDGRFVSRPIYNPITNEIVFNCDTMLKSSDVSELRKNWVNIIFLRSPIFCRTHNGICIKCYGKNMVTAQKSRIGDAVGMESTLAVIECLYKLADCESDIEEKQYLIDRTIDILSGRRRLMNNAVLSEISGVANVIPTCDTTLAKVIIENNEICSEVSYIVRSDMLEIEDGAQIKQGQKLTKGDIDIYELYYIYNTENPEKIKEVVDIATNDIQNAFSFAGITIDRIHIETFLGKMLRITKGKYSRRIISHSVLDHASDHWLSSASYTDPIMLSKSAISGSTDKLVGLNENVIVGKLIPAGSGLRIRREFEEQTEENINNTADYVDLSRFVNKTNAL